MSLFNRKDWEARQAIYRLAKQLEDKRERMTLLQELVSTLEDVNEFLDGYVDVDDGEDGQPVANKAMRLQMEVREVLKKVN